MNIDHILTIVVSFLSIAGTVAVIGKWIFRHAFDDANLVIVKTMNELKNSVEALNSSIKKLDEHETRLNDHDVKLAIHETEIADIKNQIGEK